MKIFKISHLKHRFIQFKKILNNNGVRGFKIIFYLFKSKLISVGIFNKNDYGTWSICYNTLTQDTKNQYLYQISQFKQKPLFSILIPTYNTNPDWLQESIESVRRQLYENWELCIVDDASTNLDTINVLNHYQKTDPRIKVKFRKNNGHISVASNDALAMATGEWIVLLDHDDILSASALFWVTDTINKFYKAKLIYSDEDKINNFNHHFDPYFKPDWNLDLFFSQNFVCHLSAYKKELLQKIGGFRQRFEGAQDYDCILRYLECINFDEIYHIPRILYHWRAHAKSTAQSIDSKPYSLIAGQKALQEYLDRNNISASVTTQGIYYYVKYDLPQILPLVSIVILTKNKLNFIKTCIDSLITKTSYQNYEILIVDNGTDELETLQYLDSLKSHSKIRVLENSQDFNYSALNNFGVNYANGEIIALLNNDIEIISHDWLDEMISLALQPNVGIVGAKLLYPNDTVQHGGIILGIGGIAGHAHKHLSRFNGGYFNRSLLRQSVSAVTGACLVVRKSVYNAVSGLDENIRVAFNDVDFCLRVKEKGYRNIWTPYAELYHHESITRGYETTRKKHERFLEEISLINTRWAEKLKFDPAYNPNLTHHHEDFSLAWPPRIKMDYDSL